MESILIVEDEPAIADLIALTLSSAGYRFDVAGDGDLAADLISERDYLLVLLDIMLPGLDGYELMEYIQPLGIPVIFLTAKDEVADRVKGLRLGAEDYISKPFEPEELLLRVEAVLRRNNRGSTLMEFLDVTLDPSERLVHRNGIEVSLTPKEFDLLLLLMRNRGKMLYRSYLYESLWGEEIGDTRTLDTHIQRLRRKLGWNKQIKTFYKTGYRLEV